MIDFELSLGLQLALHKLRGQGLSLLPTHGPEPVRGLPVHGIDPGKLCVLFPGQAHVPLVEIVDSVVVAVESCVQSVALTRQKQDLTIKDILALPENML